MNRSATRTETLPPTLPPRQPVPRDRPSETRADLPLVVLRSFLSVVQLGSVSQAAQQLHCSVSTVSMHITALEDRVGARLLQRDRRGCPLTRAGIRAMPRIAQLIGETEELTNLVYSSVKE
ncbi:helix-turn-helix domain-containing protein [Quadrisphaera granulorum]|uniref:LysR family transcriptional regulator n=1 Tax=Quadrisphaera granulorum TaxID=317664 RepID=UPI000D6CC0E6